MSDIIQSPPGINTEVPTTARIYDYWLGGHDHFAADRIAALKVTEAAPEAPLLAIENRKFLRRAVRYLATEAGISQFLDIGTGLPTQGNVNEIAHQVNPDARIVYVDNDEMVIAHSRALKTGPNVAVVRADLRNPRTILDRPIGTTIGQRRHLINRIVAWQQRRPGRQFRDASCCWGLRPIHLED